MYADRTRDRAKSRSADSLKFISEIPRFYKEQQIRVWLVFADYGSQNKHLLEAFKSVRVSNGKVQQLQRGGEASKSTGNVSK